MGVIVCPRPALIDGMTAPLVRGARPGLV